MKNIHQNKGLKYLKQVQIQIPYFGILLTLIYSLYEPTINCFLIQKCP